jgi:hypothetical protein
LAFKKNGVPADAMSAPRKAGFSLESAAIPAFPVRRTELPRTRVVTPAKRAIPNWDWFSTSFSQNETLVPDRDPGRLCPYVKEQLKGRGGVEYLDVSP